MSSSSQNEALRQLDRRTWIGRHHHLDLTHRTHLHHHPTGALFFPQLATPTETLVLPNSPPPNPNRTQAMPTRQRTRAHDRAYRINHERALNRARYKADPPPF